MCDNRFTPDSQHDFSVGGGEEESLERQPLMNLVCRRYKLFNNKIGSHYNEEKVP